MTDANPSRGTDNYAHGHQPSVLASHATRTADNSCGYFLDRVRTGQRILDIGCGPGSITLDLAALVGEEGRVTGVDFSAEAIAAARLAAADRGDVVTEFLVGDVFELDLEPASFDVVHAHQVMQHLTDPVAALEAMARFVKPGGILAARDADYGAMAWYPAAEGLQRWHTTYCDSARALGGEPDAGRRLRAWAHQADLHVVLARSSAWSYATTEPAAWWGNSQAERVTSSSFAQRAADQGATPEQLTAMADDWRTCGQHPDAWSDAPTEDKRSGNPRRGSVRPPPRAARRYRGRMPSSPVPDASTGGRAPRTYARPRASLLYVLERTWTRLMGMQVWDVAAAMTFFAVLSLLPTLVALVSLVSLLGVEARTVETAARLATEVWPSLDAAEVSAWILNAGRTATGTPGLVLGAAGAVVSASGAVGAFHRAMHRIYDTREGRPFLVYRLVVLLETLALIVGAALVMSLMVLGGDLSERLGRLLGVGRGAVAVWNASTWPMILVLLALIVSVAYRRGPNVRPPRHRPFSLGAVGAVALLFAAALALGWIVARFGGLALVGRLNSALGVLGLAWAACIVLVAGAAFDAEMLRARQLAVGGESADELQLATRDTWVLRQVERQEARHLRVGRLVAEAVRSEEPVTTPATRLLAEAGSLFAVDAAGRSASDLTSGRPFHAVPPADRAGV